ncbi:M1 family metallopeptidase, partial [bacterium]|nr:M1 family metallopeptidase [bacterium]
IGRKILLLGLTFWACHVALGQEYEAQQSARCKVDRFLKVQQLQSLMTPNQELYDIKYYQLDLNMDPAKKLVSGKVDVIGVVSKSSIVTLDLDLFDSMVVEKVMAAGKSVNSTHRNAILTIPLDRTYNAGEKFQVTVFYHGNPEANGGSEYFRFDQHNGAPMIWSLSQPFGARAWWPCKDYPADKADSADIKVTVPNGLIVASNGKLREKTTTGATTRYWWHESYPITTYLISVAIHPYTVFSDYYKYSNRDSMEIQFYVFPDNYATQRSAHLQTAEMLRIFSKLFGQYPFIREKYGHADFLWSGGMEHQTISSLGLTSTWLIAHELAHQWWGDMITCGNFDHIWLNEGFATYAEALYVEQKEGKQAYHQSMKEKQYLGSGTIYSENLSTDDIFNLNLRYRKASWVLHMLRHVMGDSVFFRTLRTYHINPAVTYGTATTEDFRAICEKVSGFNLHRFFQQWIYESNYPQYEYEWTWKSTGNGYDINLRIDQVQKNTVIFQMPIDIRIHTTQGFSDFVVKDSLQSQNFTLHVDKLPQRIEFDRENWILKNVKSRVTNPTFRNGILLVNGIHWGRYYDEIYKAYENKAFWGNLKFSFWDCFPDLGSSYPATLPKPIGHGPIPAEELG